MDFLADLDLRPLAAGIRAGLSSTQLASRLAKDRTRLKLWSCRLIGVRRHKPPRRLDQALRRQGEPYLGRRIAYRWDQRLYLRADNTAANQEAAGLHPPM